MNKKNVFLILRILFISIDKLITRFFGQGVRQSFVKLAYKVKVKLFPEYGNHMPAPGVVKLEAKNGLWIQPALPEWAVEEMRVLGKEIDPVLYPSDQALSAIQYYIFPVVPRPGEIYRDLLSNCGSKSYTHCFAIPWLKRGGADLVSLWHIRFAFEQPNSKVLVLLTEPGDSPWLSRIPDGVDVIDFGARANELPFDELMLVIVRLLVQLDIEVLHVINSRHVWEVVCRYGLAVRQKTRIFASVYCDDYDKYGQPVGFARSYLPRCYRHLDCVFSDNVEFPLLLQRTYGYEKSLFRVLKSPIEFSASKGEQYSGSDYKVLWAGRLDRQKRPDILLAVARAMPDVEFIVYGDALLDSNSDALSGLQRQNNIKLMGAFDGVESLPFEQFPVFLYTSQWDGTPTILIAAALSGIPIVASCVGGVRDLITENTGYPVYDIESIEEYVIALRCVLDQKGDALARAMSARRHAQSTHSIESFYAALSSIPMYVLDGASSSEVQGAI